MERIRHKKPDCGGFTLVEVIVVLVILAILAAFGVSALIGYIDRAHATTCTVNRRYLQMELTTAYIADGEGFEEPDLKEYACPSGGTISYSLIGGKFVVDCSVHTGWNQNVLPLAFEKVFSKYAGKSIDSTAIQGENDKKYLDLKSSLEALKAEGIDLSNLGAVSWRKTNNLGTVFEWSTVDITNLPVGTEVPVIRYRYDGEYAGQYSVWIFKVGTVTANGATYNGLGSQQKQLTGSSQLTSEEKLDIQNAKKVYNEYAKENGLQLLK